MFQHFNSTVLVVLALTASSSLPSHAEPSSIDKCVALLRACRAPLKPQPSTVTKDYLVEFLPGASVARIVSADSTTGAQRTGVVAIENSSGTWRVSSDGELLKFFTEDPTFRADQNFAVVKKDDQEKRCKEKYKECLQKCRKK